ncbi:peptidoglycan-binding protein [Maritimibacter sp. UBA3975]|uniref:peptidoglycan-binding protein n=1 Tax=Maritimibacter sp. UBA3975 TaxID=1946833 RepID=UPI0025BC8C93|nr:peptidoglycan-binding protein [Maritimibacter sp. UBA3975]|tara:strand:- start:6316 stop:7965 length:1650 start_codon:yes stop_codon:yes gene_type:complete
MRKSILSKTLATSFAVLATVPQIAAADAALIVVQSEYENLPDVSGAAQAVTLAQKLEDEGFSVTSSLDQEAADVRGAVEDFRDDAEGSDRVLVYLAGHMVGGPRDSYLLTHEAETPNAVSVGGEALAIGPILDVLAQYQGQSVLLTAPAGDEVAGTGLSDDLDIEAPQGVTILSGPVDRVIRVANEVLLVPGLPLGVGLEDGPGGVTARGFVSDVVPFLPAEGDGRVVIERTAQSPDEAFWVVAQTMDTDEGLELYLEYFPDGTHANEARAALTESEETQANADARAEDALDLNRAARRQVQRNLALLDHDPRGIDGIFGPATRSAIRSYQSANGFAVTGYLTREMLAEMTQRADARAAELEREAAERQARQEREDRRYWNQIGQGQDEAGLRAYLDRYPDGLFADVARERLDDIEADKRSRAEAEEREFWDRVRNSDQPRSYRTYLDRYPNGIFAQEARARLGEFNNQEDREPELTAAEREEQQVAGTKVTRLLVETKLASLDYNVGKVDGLFTPGTRTAIRRFQSSRNIPVTGFVTQQTMVRLLAAF